MMHRPIPPSYSPPAYGQPQQLQPHNDLAQWGLQRRAASAAQPSPYLSPEDRADHNTFQQQESPNLQDVPEVEERNRGRGLRGAANACEMAGNSAIAAVFVFGVHAAGASPALLIIGLVGGHCFFTAVSLGEGRSRFIANAMSAISIGSTGLLCLAEPALERWEARGARSQSYSVYQDAYVPPAPSLFEGASLPMVAVVGVLLVGLLATLRK